MKYSFCIFQDGNPLVHIGLLLNGESVYPVMQDGKIVSGDFF